MNPDAIENTADTTPANVAAPSCALPFDEPPAVAAKPKVKGSGIKKFVGFQTDDGMFHKTQADAIAHTTEQRIKEALTEAFGEDCLSVDTPGVSLTDYDHCVVHSEDVAAFLFANREAILKALNQTVRTRAPGAGRKKKETAAA